MTDDDTHRAGTEQVDEERSSKTEESDTVTTSEGVETSVARKMTKSKSKLWSTSKSRMSIERKKTPSMTRHEWIEPIVAPAAIALEDLKDGYYRDLRSLVPPPEVDPRDRGGGVATTDKWLRDVHDAIDEIDRALDRVHAELLRLDPCDTGTTDLPEECGRLPFSGSQPKPSSGIEAKPYHLKTADDDWCHALSGTTGADDKLFWTENVDKTAQAYSEKS